MDIFGMLRQAEGSNTAVFYHYMSVSSNNVQNKSLEVNIITQHYNGGM